MVVAVVLTRALGELAVGELPRGLADELLLVGQVEVHGPRRYYDGAQWTSSRSSSAAPSLFFVVFVLLLGVFSKRSARDYLDWKPTRSPEVEAQNEIDDVEQMIAAQNEMRRRRGAPEITREEIEERWRES